MDLFDQLKGGVKEFPAVTDLKDPDIYCDVARIGIHISNIFLAIFFLAYIW